MGSEAPGPGGSDSAEIRPLEKMANCPNHDGRGLGSLQVGSGLTSVPKGLVHRRDFWLVIVFACLLLS